jgi:hypothetical protein
MTVGRATLDRENRRRVAELLRHFVAGQITNDEFEIRSPRRSRDLAVRQILSEGAWFLYDDRHEHRLTGKYKLTPEARENVARWILFLETDLPYEWPVMPFALRFALMPLNLMTVGLLGRLVQRYASRGGPVELWPFRRAWDYNAALMRPPYLNG